LKLGATAEEVLMNRKAKILFFFQWQRGAVRMAQAFFRRMIGHQMDGASTAEELVDDDPLVVEVMQQVGIDISNQRVC
jgi:protein-tyrosine-phosphatase